MLGSLTRRKLLENARTAGLFIPVAKFFKDTAFAAPDGKQRLLLVFTPNGKHHNSTFVSNNVNGPERHHAGWRWFPPT